MSLRRGEFGAGPPSGEPGLDHAEGPAELLVIDRGRLEIGWHFAVPAGGPLELGLDLGRFCCPASGGALVFGERA